MIGIGRKIEDQAEKGPGPGKEGEVVQKNESEVGQENEEVDQEIDQEIDRKENGQKTVQAEMGLEARTKVG